MDLTCVSWLPYPRGENPQITMFEAALFAVISWPRLCAKRFSLKINTYSSIHSPRSTLTFWPFHNPEQEYRGTRDRAVSHTSTISLSIAVSVHSLYFKGEMKQRVVKSLREEVDGLSVM